MENTQDIIKGYLNGGRYQNKSDPLADTDDEFDLDSLVDPLDDSFQIETVHVPTFPSPPTPHESPLRHHTKLRGSPVKLTRPSPRKEDFGKAEEEICSRFDHSEMLDTHKFVNKFPEHISSSKEFENYSLLLASSMDKLIKQLAAEKKRSRDLEAKLARHENDKFQAQVTKSDYDLLMGQFSELKEKHDQLLRRSQMNEDNDARLVRENKLLREKLIKYKKLYEDLRDRQVPAAEPSHIATRPQSAPRTNPGALREEQLPKRSVSADMYVPPKRQSGAETNAELDYQSEEQERSNVNQLGALVQRLAEFVNIHSATDPEQARSESGSHANPANNGPSVDPVPMAQGSVAHYASEEAKLPTNYSHIISELAHSVEQIGHDLHRINSTLLHTSKSRGLDPRQTRMDSSDKRLVDVNKHRSDGSFSERGAMPDFTNWPQTKTQLDERDLNSNRYGRSCTHNPRQCSACAKASTSAPSRPSLDSSAPDSDSLGGPTQALMGRYTWNRTI